MMVGFNLTNDAYVGDEGKSSRALLLDVDVSTGILGDSHGVGKDGSSVAGGGGDLRQWC